MSYGLTAAQVALIADGAAFSWSIGLPFNRHLTIHWEAIGIDDAHAADATTAFLKRATDWTRKAGGTFAAVFVRENGDGKGSHVHILFHVPLALTTRFRAMPMRWIKPLRGKVAHKRGTIRTRPIGGRLATSQTSPQLYGPNLAAVVAYIVKGADPLAAAALDLPKREPGGPIIGKRAGTTQNVGRAAQRLARLPKTKEDY